LLGTVIDANKIKGFSNIEGKIIKMHLSTDLWRKTLVPMGSTIEDVIKNLDANSLKIVLIVNQEGTLEGTISDGDVRRGLLAGLSLASDASSILNNKPMVVPLNVDRGLVIQLMKSNKIQQIPIVDSGNNVIGLHLWDSINTVEELQNKMVIMAGGKGSRLLHHTENCPKPMVLLHGKPMLEHLIERAKVEGFRHIILSVNYLGHMVEEYFGNGDEFDIQIDYLRENSALGTAGALSLLRTEPEAPLVVTNCDVMSDIRYRDVLDFHTLHAASGTMAVRMHEWQNPFGVVETRGIDIIDFDEKPVTRSNINAGVYVLEPSALKHLTHDEHCDMPTLFKRLRISAGRTIAYPIYEPWLDIGRPEDIVKASGHLNARVSDLKND
jgi:dTDP-glucose pyrophosphorylase